MTGVTGEDIPAMQAAETVVFAAGGQQPLRTACFTVEFVAGILTAY